MPTTSTAVSDLSRAGGVTAKQFYDVFGVIFESVFTLLETPIFGIPLYVVLICIGVVGAIFALLSNKKGGDSN